ncbi:hypothetical protein DOTSEDRAFT_27013 [Dothistroma septosporum NZE10]|uniref:Uncharacterized protein n=1 Tax=Dothistroma septosporum (strain NZE10 / CBS 128990) TaxID=675120 RepID=N1PIF0_DOTSN|nr:hypothetical protein DOTSEDRAFT_27013 [Dothistroma septosporum NZE10]
MRLLAGLTTLLGLTQDTTLSTTSKPNSTKALNATLPSIDSTSPSVLDRRDLPWTGTGWPPAWHYKPTKNTQILIMRFKTDKCKIPKTLQHESHLEIAPEGYEDDVDIVCMNFKRPLSSVMFQLPHPILKQAETESHPDRDRYHGPLHRCRIVVYEGHACDGPEVGRYNEEQELECLPALGGYSMRAACWK